MAATITEIEKAVVCEWPQGYLLTEGRWRLILEARQKAGHILSAAEVEAVLTAQCHSAIGISSQRS
jgi:hypothetical protein